MAGQKVLHGLADGKLDIGHAAVAQDHDKEAEPYSGVAHVDRAVGAPVDLGAVSGGKGQSQVGADLRRAELAHVLFDDGVAAVKALLADALQDLGGAVGVILEQAGDVFFKRVELAGPRS